VLKVASLSLFFPQTPAFVIYGLTCVIGVFNHYIVPHVRKEMPWLLFSEPIVKPREWDAYEVSGIFYSTTFYWIFFAVIVVWWLGVYLVWSACQLHWGMQIRN
jgi:hypothetical protein